MAVIKIAGFEGAQPRVSPRLLSPSMAVTAENVSLKRGIVRPIKDMAPLFAVTGLEVVDSTDDDVVASGVTVTCGQITSFFKLKDVWVSWDASDVDVIESYIPDSDDRIYYTGDGAPKQTDYTLATDGYESHEYPGAYYTLGISPPRFKPKVEVKGIGNGTIRFASRYVYTYVTNWGEESAPSPPSEIVQPEEGQYVEITDFLECEDPDPDNVRGIRVYRIGVGELGAEYMYVSWPQPNAVSPDADFIDDYSDETDYAVDDHVIWTDDIVYKCILANGPGESVGVQACDQATYWTAQSIIAIPNVPNHGIIESVIEDCEDAWDEWVNADVTSALDAVDYKFGSGSAKLTLDTDTMSGEILATEAFSAIDLSERQKIRAWIRSSVATNAGDLLLLLDDTADCASPLESLSIPALTANVWQYVELQLSDPILLTDIISVGLKHKDGFGLASGTVLNIDHVNANDDYAVDDFCYWPKSADGDDFVYRCILACGPGTAVGAQYPSSDTYFEQWTPEDIPEDDAVADGFIDQISNYELGEQIVTEGWLPPPDNLAGLIEFTNGVFVGFAGKTLHVSEPYYPYAWPLDYTMQFPFTIIAIGWYGESLIVLTDSRPYLITGYDPQTMTSQPLPFDRPCLSKRGTVSTERGVIFPTEDGFFKIDQNGGALLTRSIWTKEQWQEFPLTDILAFYYEEELFVFFADKDTGFSFFLDEKPSVITYDFDGKFTRYGRVQDGDLYLLTYFQGASGSHIYGFEGGTSNMSGVWTSKVYQYNSAKNFVAARIFGNFAGDSSTTVIFKWYVDNVLRLTKPITNEDFFRLPAIKGNDFQIQVEGDIVEIDTIVVGTSKDEMMEVEALAGD